MPPEAPSNFFHLSIGVINCSIFAVFFEIIVISAEIDILVSSVLFVWVACKVFEGKIITSSCSGMRLTELEFKKVLFQTDYV